MAKRVQILSKMVFSACVILLASCVALPFAYADVENGAGQDSNDVTQNGGNADRGGSSAQESPMAGGSLDLGQGGAAGSDVDNPPQVAVPDGWHQDEAANTWSYYRNGEPAQGWLSYGGNWYLLGEDGVMKIGLQVYEGETYYLNPESGSLPLGAMRMGWIPFDEGWRYFSPSGCMQVGWLLDSGTWYWLDSETGIMASGVAYCNGLPYHFGESGAMTTGWALDNDAWYLSETSGELKSGWQKQGSYWYWLNSDTFAMQTGWLNLGVGGSDEWYYLQPSGAMQTGWASVGGVWYYFLDGGTMVSDCWQRVGAAWYHFAGSGAMQTGWLNLGVGGSDEWYYLKSSGAMQTGWAHINDQYGSRYYYFGYNGVMTKNLLQPERLRQDLYNEGWYISPLLADAANTREERIEAMIATAYEYLGNTYRACYSQAPGGYVDCSGLAMQGLYAAGFDPDPISPKRHSNPAYEYESRNMWNLNIQRVSYADRQRGDLIYYDNGYGTIIHVAIYLGNDQVIEAWPPRVTVWPIINSAHPRVYGVQRPF